MNFIQQILKKIKKEKDFTEQEQEQEQERNENGTVVGLEPIETTKGI